MDFNLKKIRKSLDLNQSELAEKLQVSLKTISNWESGSNDIPLKKAIKFCEIFNLNIDDLLINKNLTKKSEIRFDEPEISVDEQLAKMSKRVKDLEKLNENLQEALIRAMDKL